MIWKSILISCILLFIVILDSLGKLDIGWHSIVLLVIAALPVILPLMAKYMESFKAGKGGIEGKFRQGISKIEAALPAYTAPSQATRQISTYERFSVWARKILKALWTYQIQYFGEDSKERWGFTVNKDLPDFLLYHIGIGELLYHQYVFSDSRGLYFLTDAGIEFCKQNRNAIEEETHYYKDFGSINP